MVAFTAPKLFHSFAAMVEIKRCGASVAWDWKPGRLAGGAATAMRGKSISAVRCDGIEM